MTAAEREKRRARDNGVSLSRDGNGVRASQTCNNRDGCIRAGREMVKADAVPRG